MKKTTKVALVVAIAAAVVVAVLVGIVYAVTTVLRDAGEKNNNYSAQVQTLEAAQKTYAAGSTAEIGPYDVRVNTVQQNYTPTKEEASVAQDVLDRHQRFGVTNDHPDVYGYSLTDETGQYVRVTLDIAYNSARAGYDTLKTSSYDWIGQLETMLLNDMQPLVITPDLGLYAGIQQIETEAKKDSGTTVTLLYRIPKETQALALHYEIIIFTEVSSFVGTEGMPSKTYEYTIGIQ